MESNTKNTEITELIPLDQALIAIIYLAIGKYDVFWDEFYHSCEQFLFSESKKHYFVFTDSSKLLSLQSENVTIIPYIDRGWVTNVMAKSHCILSVRSSLEKYEYVFYINANYKVLSPISCQDILPGENEGYLSALSFDIYRDLDKELYGYDRNPESQAFIPYGEGSYYYQGGFYGGRVTEVLALTEAIEYASQIDRAKGIMALWHDESYLNKYLLNRTPRIISMQYCKPEELSGKCKAILRDKDKMIGRQVVDQMKAIFIDSSLSYLQSHGYESRPLHLVEACGQLGDQMFQYAFLLGLRNRCISNNYQMCYKEQLNHKGFVNYCLQNVFDLPSDDFATEELIARVAKTPESYIHRVFERQTGYQPVNVDWQLVSVYQGYWQTERYFKDIEPVIRNAFHFDETKLSVESQEMASAIRAGMSVSVHVGMQEYYTDAISQMKSYLPAKEIRFYLFGDDTDWIKKNYPLENSVVIDWNSGCENWQNMFLISICNHHIVANNSFSWWGAWLNKKVDKIVIAPYRWYNTMLCPDILPENWKRILPLGYMENSLIRDLEYNRLSLDKNGLFYGKMGLAIFLFHYAQISGNKFYAYIAGGLLDLVFENLDNQSSLDYAEGLAGIGTGIEYLLQNEFVKGKADDILMDLDLLFDKAVSYPLNDLSLENDICGWIRYLQFRIAGGSVGRNMDRYLQNKRNLDDLQEYVQTKKDNINDLFDCFAGGWDDSIGLRGRAGWELTRLNIQSQVSWQNLLYC